MLKFFSYCPQCASQNFDFENYHRFECKDCKFVYYHNVASAVIVLVERDGKFLFTRRSNEPAKGTLDFPGGFVDPGENAQQAASREMQEELNLIIKPEKLQLLHTESNDYEFRDIMYRTLDVVFYISLSAFPKLKIDASEIDEILWLSPTEVNVEDVGFKSTKKIVEQFIISGKLLEKIKAEQ
ncbi:MAG: NUDIX domain-containing protein [Weeksellaceae bacterium]|nr:NUDIX domain-containing protein [Weeksellaceae bacterium]